MLRKPLILFAIVLLSISMTYAESFNFEFVGAMEGVTHAVAVSEDGNTAYIAAHPYFCVLDVSQKSNPFLLGKICIPRFYIGDIAVADDYAYVASGFLGLQVVNVSNPSTPFLVEI